MTFNLEKMKTVYLRFFPFCASIHQYLNNLHANVHIGTFMESEIIDT